MAFDGHYLDWNQKRIKGIIDFYGYKFMYYKKILDLGCGYADISGALHRLGADVTAVDGRNEHLKIVSKKFAGIKTIHTDLDRGWPFQNKVFDIVLDLGLLCHLSNYETHLRSVCASTTHLILETAVCDSDDPYKNVQVTENKGIYDLSVNGLGCRPSAAAIERVLDECGMNFRRIDNSKFNAAGYTYDWLSKNDNNININNRRIWFAIKKSSPIQFSQLRTEPELIPSTTILQSIDNSKLPFVQQSTRNIAALPTPPYVVPVNPPPQQINYIPQIKISPPITTSDSKIRLFYNYYEEKDLLRKQEIDSCLQNNINNPFFDIIVLDSLQRPTFNFFFEKINRLVKDNDISIICSSDIFFDNTIALAQKIKHNEIFALSHWDILAGGKTVLSERPDEQDAWIIRGKIDSVDGSFPTGLPGSDNRIAFEFQKAGYNIINPCRSIKIYHAHNSNIKTYTESDRVQGKYLNVDLTSL